MVPNNKKGDTNNVIHHMNSITHLFQLNHTKTNNGSQYRCGNGGTLNQHGNGSTNNDGNHTWNLGSLVNDTGGHSHQSTLQYIHQSHQTNQKKYQRKEETYTS